MCKVLSGQMNQPGTEREGGVSTFPGPRGEGCCGLEPSLQLPRGRDVGKRVARAVS